MANGRLYGCFANKPNAPKCHVRGESDPFQKSKLSLVRMAYAGLGVRFKG